MDFHGSSDSSSHHITDRNIPSSSGLEMPPGPPWKNGCCVCSSPGGELVNVTPCWRQQRGALGVRPLESVLAEMHVWISLAKADLLRWLERADGDSLVGKLKKSFCELRMERKKTKRGETSGRTDIVGAVWADRGEGLAFKGPTATCRRNGWPARTGLKVAMMVIWHPFPRLVGIPAVLLSMFLV